MDKSFLETNANNLFSIEIFPVPDGEKLDALLQTVKEYSLLGIKTVHVTCKAGWMEPTQNLVRRLRKETNIVVIPHIVCCLLSVQELNKALQEYTDLGIRNLLVVRGDTGILNNTLSSSQEFVYAKDLVTQIKSWTSDFSIGVAGFPETHFMEPNFLKEAQYLYEKINAGADYIITQLFFDDRDFEDFIERCRLFNITVPIIPGLTYIKDKKHSDSIAKMALGSRIPSTLLSELYKEIPDCGINWIKYQVRDIINSKLANLVHLYTFNTTIPFTDIIQEHNNK